MCEALRASKVFEASPYRDFSPGLNGPPQAAAQALGVPSGVQQRHT